MTYHFRALACNCVSSLQLDVGLTKRDPRWHCERSYQMRLAGGAAELFFIDTNPFISSYHNVSWANQLGAGRHLGQGFCQNTLGDQWPSLVSIRCEYFSDPWLHEASPAPAPTCQQYRTSRLSFSSVPGMQHVFRFAEALRSF